MPGHERGMCGDGQGDLRVHGVRVQHVVDMCSVEYDALVVVLTPDVLPPAALQQFIAEAVALDSALHKKTTCVLRCAAASGGRLVLSCTGPLTPYDDIRSVKEASRAGVERAAAAGARCPVLVVQEHPEHSRAPLVCVLGALDALIVPLQVRESFPAQAHKVHSLGILAEGLRCDVDLLLREAIALETARGLACDIGGADPERMTALAAAELVQEQFAGSPRVSVRVERDAAALEQKYPLFAAVNRAAGHVPRHAGCVLHAEYVPPQYERTLMLVGKGVTYDTGGCDIKAGGVMAGMSRDKCGAAAVAGFLKACELLEAPVKVVCALALVRNSVGSEAYVADEVVRSYRGLAVRVGNTDAEGRMAMADLLAEMAERAPLERRPHLYTVATLTGHAHRTVGDGYTIVVDNHVARGAGHAQALAEAGASIGDMVEVSSIRREDLSAHRGRVAGDHLHQADSRPSVATPRGHQAPAAFLLLAAGLDVGDTPYSHLDVAASAGSLPDPPTGAPILALVAHAGLLRSC